MNRSRLIPAVLLALALAGCGNNGPPLSQFDAAGLIERGMDAYRSEQWRDAIRYLDRLVLEYPTHPRVQEARFYLADAYYQREEYISAASRFVRLAEDFPSGEWADDARFKACRAYQELSPEPTLDQEYTYAAIDHCQALTIYQPDSEYVPRAREVIRSMRGKLAHKTLLAGEFYLKRHAFDSAIIYFEQVLEQFPESRSAPEALRRLVEAYERIGYDEDAEATRQRLLRDYPQSPAARGLASAEG